MTIRFISDDDRLAELERMIYSLKSAGVPPERVSIYSSLASEIRARRPGAGAEALKELGRRLDVAFKSKTALGYEQGALVGVAQELVGRWGVVKLALEQFEGGRT